MVRTANQGSPTVRTANQAAAVVRTTNQEAAGARTTSPAARTTNGEAASGKDIPGSESKESRRVKIEYLGSIPVENKATDLRSLQVSSGI